MENSETLERVQKGREGKNGSDDWWVVSGNEKGKVASSVAKGL